MKKIGILSLILFNSIYIAAQIWVPMGIGLSQTPTVVSSKNNAMAVCYSSEISGSNKKLHTILIWNSFSWISLPDLIGDSASQIKVLYFYDNALYIAGKFDQLNEISNSTHIIRWKNRRYESLPNFTANLTNFEMVDDLDQFNNQLIISGNLQQSTSTGNGAIAYNGSQITALPTNFGKGLNGRVMISEKIDANTLFFGGVISNVDATVVKNMAYYNKSNGWNSIKNPLSLFPTNAASYKENLIISGESLKRENLNFYTLDDSDSLISLDKGIISITAIYDLITIDTNLYASGIFEMKDTKSDQNLIRWNGEEWVSITNGDLSNIRLLGRSNNQLVATGFFQNNGLLPLKRVALYKENVALVAGRVFFDKNKDCKFDSRDEPLSFMTVTIDQKPTLIPGDNGVYFSLVDPGKHTISIDTIKAWKVQPCAKHIYSIELSPGEISLLNDFPLYQKIGVKDVAVYLKSAQGFKVANNKPARYIINYENLGSENIAQTSLTLKYDARLTNFKSSVVPQTINQNELIWTLDNLYAGEKGVIEISFEVSAPTNDAINLQAIISSAQGETETEDNSSSLVQYLGDDEFDFKKEVFPSINGDSATVLSSARMIDYQISFANYTEDTIRTVIVIDTIKLNHSMSYIKEVGKSHNASLSAYSGNPGTDIGVLVWRFENINLPPNPNKNPEIVNHTGFVAFQIALDANLVEGTTLNNTANVIFDYFEAENTNPTYVLVSNQIANVTELALSNLVIYPNPVSEILYIKSNNPLQLKEIKIYSLDGRKIWEQNRMSNNGINVSTLESGVYIVSLRHSDGTFLKSRFIKN